MIAAQTATPHCPGEERSGQEFGLSMTVVQALGDCLPVLWKRMLGGGLNVVNCRTWRLVGARHK
jgi:hypothetical protein